MMWWPLIFILLSALNVGCAARCVKWEKRFVHKDLLGRTVTECKKSAWP